MKSKFILNQEKSSRKTITFSSCISWRLILALWFQKLDNRCVHIFFFKKPLKKNQSVVNSQCSVSFRCTARRFSYTHIYIYRASLVAQRVKRLPAMRETWVRSLGREDPLEKEMATHSNIPAWRTPWMEKPGGLLSTGPQRVGHAWAASPSHTHVCPFPDSFLSQVVTRYRM